ncbi:MAG: hypothetical protein LBF97_05005 [Elusimicrobiota bacterium]|jgi:hypothetical protein|nr:hypothetical protein [Elusimicrobiota bacterium]
MNEEILEIYTASSRQSKSRVLEAVKSGRPPKRNGAPPYLEQSELEEFISEVTRQTLINTSISFKEAANIVFFISIFYLFYRLFL